jgi:hypothetical protein
VARIKDRIIEPSDSPSDDTEAIALFNDAGWPRDDAQWLGPLCNSVLRAEDDEQPGFHEVVELNLNVVASAWNPLDSRDRALLVAYARLCGLGGKDARLGRNVKNQLPLSQVEFLKATASQFRSHGANFENALVTGGWPGEYGTDSELNGELIEFVRGRHPTYTPDILRLMQTLVDCAGLDLKKVVDLEALTAVGSKRSFIDPAAPRRVPEEIKRERPPISDARSLTNWMIALGPRALTLILEAFRSCRDDVYLAAMAVGVQDSIEKWLFCKVNHWTHFDRAGARLAEACEPYLEELEHRCLAAGDQVEPQLRKSWLWFAWCVFESDPTRWQRLPEARREAILRAANEDLAGLRPLFARAKLKPRAPVLSAILLPGEKLEPWEEFERERAHFDTCVMLLHLRGGIWRGMKPLLLAIRALACPCVAKDLRYWQEPVRGQRSVPPDELVQPPEPWVTIPASMINLFHYLAGKEQATAPDLAALRGELAKFCLERLADRWSKAERDEAARTGRVRTNQDMIEHSPEWRLCLIRAAASLHINPEGKGHRILHRAAEIDPNEDVREAARVAYQQLRRFKGLPENLSPRRAVMSALWWIRQASLLGLGIRPDPDGAQRTRIKELTRTKEAERADNPASRDV